MPQYRHADGTICNHADEKVLVFDGQSYYLENECPGQAWRIIREADRKLRDMYTTGGIVRHYPGLYGDQVPAFLHQGEQVLTAAQARDFRKQIAEISSYGTSAIWVTAGGRTRGTAGGISGT